MRQRTPRASSRCTSASMAASRSECACAQWGKRRACGAARTFLASRSTCPHHTHLTGTTVTVLIHAPSPKQPPVLDTRLGPRHPSNYRCACTFASPDVSADAEREIVSSIVRSRRCSVSVRYVFFSASSDSSSARVEWAERSLSRVARSSSYTGHVSAARKSSTVGRQRLRFARA